MSEVKREFSENELMEFARKFMRETAGEPKSMDNEAKDAYYGELGLLVHFIKELWISKDKV